MAEISVKPPEALEIYSGNPAHCCEGHPRKSFPNCPIVLECESNTNGSNLLLLKHTTCIKLLFVGNLLLALQDFIRVFPLAEFCWVVLVGLAAL